MTFPIGIYTPALIPMIVAFMVTVTETIGDIGATYEASELDVDSKDYDHSVQGGLLMDGINTFVASVATTMPITTFAGNNGVISLVSEPPV